MSAAETTGGCNGVSKSTGNGDVQKSGVAYLANRVPGRGWLLTPRLKELRGGRGAVCVGNCSVTLRRRLCRDPLFVCPLPGDALGPSSRSKAARGARKEQAVTLRKEKRREVIALKRIRHDHDDPDDDELLDGENCTPRV